MTRADKRARQKERSRRAREAREAAQKRQQRKSIALRVGVSFLIVAVLIGITALLRNGGGDDDDNANADATTTSAAATTTTPTTAATPAVLPAGCVETKPPANPKRGKQFSKAPAMTIDTSKTYTATIKTSCGDVTIALDAKNDPKSVNNFVFLARQGFYDGLTWHRISKDFVIQGGDPKGDGSGSAGYTVAGESPSKPGYAVGAVAWAKSGNDPAGTASSQFFIVTGSGAAQLPNDYGMIGTVTAGIQNAQKIATLFPTDSGDGPPTLPMYMYKVTITES